VEAERYRSAPLSEPYVKVSLHTAQASQKKTPWWGGPVAKLSFATFAIVISGLLTSRRTGAPAEAVICFPVCEGSLNFLATRHLSDVSLSIRPEDKSGVSRGPCFRSYPPHYREAFASSDLFLPSLQQLPYG
jgi:hypothetical protein